MFYRMKLSDEAVGVIIANNGLELIIIYNFASYIRNKCRVSARYYEGLEGLQGGCPILGMKFQQQMSRNYKE